MDSFRCYRCYSVSLTLRGIAETGMMLLIEGLKPQEKKLGFTVDKIRMDIEQKLKTANI
jgi:hypothetical protein